MLSLGWLSEGLGAEEEEFGLGAGSDSEDLAESEKAARE
jgi:hypothetical protein